MHVNSTKLAIAIFSNTPPVYSTVSQRIAQKKNTYRVKKERSLLEVSRHEGGRSERVWKVDRMIMNSKK